MKSSNEAIRVPGELAMEILNFRPAKNTIRLMTDDHGQYRSKRTFGIETSHYDIVTKCEIIIDLITQINHIMKYFKNLLRYISLDSITCKYKTKKYFIDFTRPSNHITGQLDSCPNLFISNMASSIMNGSITESQRWFMNKSTCDSRFIISTCRSIIDETTKYWRSLPTFPLVIQCSKPHSIDVSHLETFGNVKRRLSIRTDIKLYFDDRELHEDETMMILSGNLVVKINVPVYTLK
jgi:hypothetical protein